MNIPRSSDRCRISPTCKLSKIRTSVSSTRNCQIITRSPIISCRKKVGKIPGNIRTTRTQSAILLGITDFLNKIIHKPAARSAMRISRNIFQLNTDNRIYSMFSETAIEIHPVHIDPCKHIRFFSTRITDSFSIRVHSRPICPSIIRSSMIIQIIYTELYCSAKSLNNIIF